MDSKIRSNATISVHFQPLDVTKPESWAYQKNFLKADLFTFSYFVSEIKAFNQGGVVGNFLETVLNGALPGADFLYVDNGHTDFNNFFDTFWRNRTDIECLHEEDNSWTLPRYSEQADTLGEYRTKFGHQPKLKSMISTRILRKTR